MAIAFWCLLVVVLAPYVLSVLARSQVTRADYVDDPRAYSDRLTGWHRRAHLAHLNAFEAVPGIVAGVMVAEFSGVPQNYIDGIAIAFVILRVLHATFYLVNRPMWRSHAWRLGMICIISLFILAAVVGQPRP